MQRSLISLIVGGILALVAVGGLTYYLRTTQNPSASAGSNIELGNVVVATADLPFGTHVSRDQLSVVAWPASSMPVDAFHSVEEVFAGSQGFDRIVLKPIDKGEALLKSRISGFGAKATLSRQVPIGMRAVSIRVDDVSGVAGFILPGDRVDVMLTRRLEATTPDSSLVTDVILQNILVLGIDQLSDQDREKPVVARTATVAVTPEQAQKLALAQQAGTLGLSLRNASSVDQVPTERVVQRDLAPNSAPPAKSRNVKRAPPTIQIIYGGGRTQVAPLPAAAPSPSTPAPVTQ
jgi:pilus assembly protein CpaB